MGAKRPGRVFPLISRGASGPEAGYSQVHTAAHRSENRDGRVGGLGSRSPPGGGWGRSASVRTGPLATCGRFSRGRPRAAAAPLSASPAPLSAPTNKPRGSQAVCPRILPLHSQTGAPRRCQAAQPGAATRRPRGGEAGPGGLPPGTPRPAPCAPPGSTLSQGPSKSEAV